MKAHFWPSGRVYSFPKYPQAPLHSSENLLDLIRREHSTDAHFTVYRIPGKDTIPRLSKGAEQMDLGVEMHLIAVDIDREPHEPWDSPHDARVALREHLEKCPQAGGYTTPRGLRLVWALTTPIPIGQASTALKRWHNILRQRGLHPDPQCAHWTQAYRLPHVVVGGKKRTGHLDLYALEGGITLDFKPRKAPKRKPIPPAKAVGVHPSLVEQTILERLQQDPESRKRFGIFLGAEISGNRVYHVRCPDCGRDSVWWLVQPNNKDRHYAQCNHTGESCGWWGHLYDLRHLGKEEANGR